MNSLAQVPASLYPRHYETGRWQHPANCTIYIWLQRPIGAVGMRWSNVQGEDADNKRKRNSDLRTSCFGLISHRRGRDGEIKNGNDSSEQVLRLNIAESKFDARAEHQPRSVAPLKTTRLHIFLLLYPNTELKVPVTLTRKSLDLSRSNTSITLIHIIELAIKGFTSRSRRSHGKPDPNRA
jgi:hypothetical protein